MKKSMVQRSMRFPRDLVEWVEQGGKANERNFTKQVTFLLRGVQKKKSRAKEKVSA